MSTVSLLTAEQLLAMPGTKKHQELVRGELRMMSPSGGTHGNTTYKLTIKIGAVIEAKGLGKGFGAEVGFLIERDPDTVRAPDFAFVSKARIPAEGIPKGFVPFAPDFAAEVLSPNDSAMEIEDKVDNWIRAGVKLLWVVNPKNKTVRVHAPKRQPMVVREGETLTGEQVLPGLELPVVEIFA